jgi:hypothetical protein
VIELDLDALCVVQAALLSYHKAVCEVSTISEVDDVVQSDILGHVERVLLTVTKEIERCAEVL